MTVFQIISTALAGMATLYFGQVVIRTKTYQPINGLQVFLWISLVMACVVSWVGVR